MWEQIRKFLFWMLLVCGLVMYLTFGFQSPAIGGVMQEKITRIVFVEAFPEINFTVDEVLG